MPDAYLKRADFNDIDIIFNWANEESVRKNSFNQKIINYDEHKKWFIKIINSLENIIYIYYFKGVPVGQIRIDTEGVQGLINYSIDINYRFQGHGKTILMLLEEIICEDYPNLKYLCAKVLKTNIASQKKFEQLAYQRIENDDCIEYIKEIKNQPQTEEIPYNGIGEDALPDK